MGFAPEGGDGVEFIGNDLQYDDYVRDCLLETGLEADEIDGLFADNGRLVSYITNAAAKQKKEGVSWIARNREKNRAQSRERMRKMRERRSTPV